MQGSLQDRGHGAEALGPECQEFVDGANIGHLADDVPRLDDGDVHQLGLDCLQAGEAIVLTLED